MAKQPDDVTKYQSHYSESGFWNKVKKVAKTAGLKVIYYALLLYYLLTDADVPIGQKSIIIGALGYFILPIDLIPDILGPVGYADDVAALSAAIAAVRAYITPSIETKAKNKLNDWFGIIDESKLKY